MMRTLILRQIHSLKRRHKLKRGDLIYPGQLRVLGAIHWLRDQGKTVTIRGIMRLLGFTSVNAITPVLQQLEEFGLIGREPHKGGTIRPLCSIQLYREYLPKKEKDSC